MSGAKPGSESDWATPLTAEERALIKEGRRPSLKVKLARPGAQLPRYESERASGLDLRMCAWRFPWEKHSTEHGEAVLSSAGKSAILCFTGIAVELPPWTELQIRPRSGLSLRGVVCSFGTVDEDYRGEIAVLLSIASWARGPAVVIEPGERIAQAVIAPVVRVDVLEVEQLSDTERGTGGFGSTGRR